MDGPAIRCCDCLEMFDSKSSLKSHVAQMHLSYQPFECYCCASKQPPVQSRTSTKQQLQQHYIRAHPGQEFIVKIAEEHAKKVLLHDKISLSAQTRGNNAPPQPAAGLVPFAPAREPDPQPQPSSSKRSAEPETDDVVILEVKCPKLEIRSTFSDQYAPAISTCTSPTVSVSDHQGKRLCSLCGLGVSTMPEHIFEIHIAKDSLFCAYCEYSVRYKTALMTKHIKTQHKGKPLNWTSIKQQFIDQYKELKKKCFAQDGGKECRNWIRKENEANKNTT